MRSMVSVHGSLITKTQHEHTTKQYMWQNPKTVLSGAENTETGNNHPQTPTQNKLPKYGSQSETMTNTCL
jgi:hypothetical protein